MHRIRRNEVWTDIGLAGDLVDFAATEVVIHDQLT